MARNSEWDADIGAPAADDGGGAEEPTGETGEIPGCLRGDSRGGGDRRSWLMMMLDLLVLMSLPRIWSMTSSSALFNRLKPKLGEEFCKIRMLKHKEVQRQGC